MGGSNFEEGWREFSGSEIWIQEEKAEKCRCRYALLFVLLSSSLIIFIPFHHLLKN